MTERKLQKELHRTYKMLGGEGTLLNCNLSYALLEFVRCVANLEIRIVEANKKCHLEVGEISKEQKRILDDIQWRIVKLEDRRASK